MSREHEMLPEGKFVDLKEVFDWRYREGKWKRRRRIVAREFRTGPLTDETFSPASSFAVARFFLMLHLFYGWKLESLDISDAYSTVEQQEVCYVKIFQVGLNSFWVCLKTCCGSCEEYFPVREMEHRVGSKTSQIPEGHFLMKTSRNGHFHMISPLVSLPKSS